MEQAETPRRRLKSVFRVLLFPVLRYFGPRFTNIHLRLDKIDHHIREVHESFESLQKRLDRFEDRAFTDIETAIEIFTLQQRISAGLEQQIADLQRLLASGSANGGSEIELSSRETSTSANGGAPQDLPLVERSEAETMHPRL